MTPKEKAKELVDKYYNFGDQEFDYSKEFALIAVDEIIKNAKDYLHWMPCYSEVCGCKQYWNEVKHEIEKL